MDDWGEVAFCRSKQNLQFTGFGRTMHFTCLLMLLSFQPGYPCRFAEFSGLSSYVVYFQFCFRNAWPSLLVNETSCEIPFVFLLPPGTISTSPSFFPHKVCLISLTVRFFHTFIEDTHGSTTEVEDTLVSFAGVVGSNFGDVAFRGQ